MNTAKHNALSLYREGIQEGNAREAIEKYTGDRYTQHSTGVADGVEGFLAFFEPFLERCPVRAFEFPRALQDGRHVFLHAYQDINNKDAEWVTTDFFDTDDNGKIVEHWDVIGAFKGANASGHTEVDGETRIADLDKTDANRQLVSDYINHCLIPRNLNTIDDYVSADQFIQHSHELTDGRDAFVAFFGDPNCALAYQELFMIVAEGNFVATLNRATMNGDDICLVDLYRVEDGRIVEHWDNWEPVPPKSEWANSGKF